MWQFPAHHPPSRPISLNKLRLSTVQNISRCSALEFKLGEQCRLNYYEEEKDKDQESNQDKDEEIFENVKEDRFGDEDNEGNEFVDGDNEEGFADKDNKESGLVEEDKEVSEYGEEKFEEDMKSEQYEEAEVKEQSIYFQKPEAARVHISESTYCGHLVALNQHRKSPIKQSNFEEGKRLCRVKSVEERFDHFVKQATKSYKTTLPAVERKKQKNSKVYHKAKPLIHMTIQASNASKLKESIRLVAHPRQPSAYDFKLHQHPKASYKEISPHFRSHCILNTDTLPLYIWLGSTAPFCIVCAQYIAWKSTTIEHIKHKIDPGKRWFVVCCSCQNPTLFVTRTQLEKHYTDLHFADKRYPRTLVTGSEETAVIASSSATDFVIQCEVCRSWLLKQPFNIHYHLCQRHNYSPNSFIVKQKQDSVIFHVCSGVQGPVYGLLKLCFPSLLEKWNDTIDLSNPITTPEDFEFLFDRTDRKPALQLQTNISNESGSSSTSQLLDEINYDMEADLKTAFICKKDNTDSPLPLDDHKIELSDFDQL